MSEKGELKKGEPDHTAQKAFEFLLFQLSINKQDLLNAVEDKGRELLLVFENPDVEYAKGLGYTVLNNQGRSSYIAIPKQTIRNCSQIFDL